MDIYQHRRHNKNLLMVHLIFVTKYRKKIVLGDFRDAVKLYWSIFFVTLCSINTYL